jgi:hypothetical protein
LVQYYVKPHCIVQYHITVPVWGEGYYVIGSQPAVHLSCRYVVREEEEEEKEEMKTDVFERIRFKAHHSAE